MKKIFCIVALTVAAISFFSLTSVSFQSNSSAFVEQDVLDTFQTGPADVIVMLADVPLDSSAATKAGRLAVFQERGKKIKTTQMAVLSQLDSEDFAQRASFSIINGFAGKLTQKGLQKLLQNPAVVGIWEDKKVKLFRDVSIPLIRADDVETLGFNGTGITIAIIDSGIDNRTQPELNGTVGTTAVKNATFFCLYNATASYKCNDAIDYSGHGTHVAGIAAGRGGFGYGQGVATNVSLLNIKVFYYDSGDFYATTSDVIKGIEWAVGAGADVISMSLGGDLYSSYCDDEPLANASNWAVESANVTVVVATGNDYNKTHISSPACGSKVIAVAATNDADAVASFSNRNSITDVMAPGVGIVSTYSANATDYATYCPAFPSPPCWVGMSGTSMAAPHVSGAAALLIQAYRQEFGSDPTPAYIETKLKATGKNISDVGGSGLYFPRLDIYKALDSIKAPQFFAETRVHAAIINYNETVNITVNVTENVEIAAVWTRLGVPDGSSINATMTNLSANISSGKFNLTSAAYSFQRGSWNATFWANDTAGNLNNSATTLSWQVFGWAKINNSALSPFAIDVNQTDKNATMLCLVIDANLTAPIEGYNISFWRNSTALGTNLTNSSGWAVLTFENAVAAGLYTIKCNITDNPTLFYNDSAENFATQNLNMTDLPPTLTVESPQNKSYATSTIDYNATGSEPLAWALVSINGTANQTMTNDTSVHFFNLSTEHEALPEGIHNATFYAQDTTGNNASETVFFIVDLTSPTWSNQSVNSTERSSTALFSVYWEDNFGLSGYIFSTNNNGSWANDSWQSFSGDHWSNVIKVLNDTIGINISWQVYANDSAGNWNATEIFNLTTTCTESWSYSEWGSCSCSSRTRTRTAADANSCGTTINRSALEESCTPTGCGGGGGGGAAAAVTVELTETYIFSELVPAQPLALTITKEEIAATAVSFEVNNPAQNVKVAIKALSQKPTSIVADVTGKVYRYFEIENENLPDENIKAAEIKFKVMKSWVAENKIDAATIALNRFTTFWAALPTTAAGEDVDGYYYEAATPGFSIFAISGAVKAAPVVIRECPTSAPATGKWGACINETESRTAYRCDETINYTWLPYTESQTCVEIAKEVISTRAILIITAIVIAAAMAIVSSAFLKKHKLKRKHRYAISISRRSLQKNRLLLVLRIFYGTLLLNCLFGNASARAP